ncbi:MAG: hypothetical protein V1674_04690 [Candidatus Omnitrophota bacterium]
MENTSTSLSTRKRSKGVTIFGYWQIIEGLLGLLLCAVVIWRIISPHTSEVIKLRFERLIYPWHINIWFFILPVIGISILSFLVGNGLLKLKEWTRKWAIYLAILGIVFVFSDLFCRGFRSRLIVRAIVNVILNVIVIYFFTRPKVKEQFGLKK